MTSPRTKKLNSMLSAGKIKVTICWDNKRSYSWQLLAKWTIVNTNRNVETLKNLNAHLHRAHTQETCLKCHSSNDNTKLHTSGNTTKAIKNFEWTVLPHPPYNPDLAHQITIYFVLWKKACEDTITPMMRHYIMPHASGCRGGRVTFTRQEHTLLFKGGEECCQRWRLCWKITVFSNFVTKFCEIFT